MSSPCSLPVSSTSAILAMTLMATMVSLTLTSACPDIDSMMIMDLKLAASDVMVYGLPRSRGKSNRDGLYTVDFEVRCIIKGGPLAENIKIHRVGAEDPQCQVSELVTDVPVIVYLSRRSGQLVPIYREDPGQDQYLDEIPVLCGADITYPIGYSEQKNKETCPEIELYEGDCPTEQPATESPDSEKEVPYQPVKDNDHDHDHDDDSNKEVKVNEAGKTGTVEEDDGPENKASADCRISLIASLVMIVCCLLVQL